jgi:hypothetical protein
LKQNEKRWQLVSQNRKQEVVKTRDHNMRKLPNGPQVLTELFFLMLDFGTQPSVWYCSNNDVQVDRLYKLRIQTNSLVFIYVKSLWK